MKSKCCLLLPSLIGLLLISCGKHKSETSRAGSSRPTVEVTTSEVEWSERPLFEPSVGTVRPYRQADVSAKLAGRVLKMLAVPGKRAKEGDLLAEIDARELRSAFDQARTNRDQAKRDFERISVLYPKRSVSKSQFERSEAQYQTSVAAAREAEQALANAEVRAPFSGMVTRKDMDPGDFAMPGRSLFAMEDSSQLQLETHVAESLAGVLKNGDMIRVTVETAELDIDGEVSEISPTADVGSRTFLVKIDLPPGKLLRAGQFGRAHIPRGMQRLIEVPESAVIRRGQMEIAFVMDHDKALMRLVRTGTRDRGRVEILSGLEAGEILLLDPGTLLRDGDPVHIAAP